MEGQAPDVLGVHGVHRQPGEDVVGDIVAGEDGGVIVVEGGFDDVFQLPDVAGPVIGQKDILYLAAVCHDLLVEFLVVVLAEIFHQQGDIPLPPVQLRDIVPQHAQAVEDILPDLIPLYAALRVLVDGGDDPHVHLLFLLGADAADAVVLQHPQQLGLRRQLHGVDLVEEQSAAVGQLEQTRRILSPGVAALGGAEEDALQQGAGDGGAVLLDEGGILAAAGFLDGVDNELLAGAGLAVDQHMGIAVGGLQDLLLDADHLAILRDDVLQRLVGGVVAFGEGADEADVEAQPPLGDVGVLVDDHVDNAHHFAVLFNGDGTAVGLHGVPLVVDIGLLVVDEALSRLQCPADVAVLPLQGGINFKETAVQRLVLPQVYQIGIGGVVVADDAVFVHHHQAVHIIHQTEHLFKVLVHSSYLLRKRMGKGRDKKS